MIYDLIAHLERQREFSERTFGPGPRTQGVLDHIRKELTELEAKPDDLYEWIDVVLLALDGAWRAGHSSKAIAIALETKQTINEARSWPRWQDQDRDKAIQHERDTDTSDLCKLKMCNHMCPECDKHSMPFGSCIACGYGAGTEKFP